ncbi:MAG: TolC family protein [Planctomycetota bacterium]
MRLGRLSRCLAAACALAFAAPLGCTSYAPQPLDEWVRAGLARPSSDALAFRARDLRHPLLRPVALDEGDGLSPDEAAVFAVLVNPTLRAARTARGLAAAQVVQAGILPNPQLSYYLQPPFPTTQPGGLLNGYGLTLSWQVEALISRGARVEAAERQGQSVALDVAWQEWLVAERAKLAVGRLASLRAQLALAAEVEAGLLKNEALVQGALGEGLLTALELSAARTASTDARAARRALETQVETERLALNAALGLAPAVEVALQPTAPPGPTASAAPPTLARLLDGLERRRLDLAALRRGYEAQEERVRAAVLGQFPAVNLGLQGQQDTGGITSLGFGVTVDIPLFDRNQGAIAAERATRTRLRDEYAARLFAARNDIATLLVALRGSEAQLEIARAATPRLERLVTIYRRAVGQGQADVLSYCQAWGELNRNRLGILALERTRLEARVALELAAGIYDLEATP